MELEAANAGSSTITEHGPSIRDEYRPRLTLLTPLHDLDPEATSPIAKDVRKSTRFALRHAGSSQEDARLSPRLKRTRSNSDLRLARELARGPASPKTASLPPPPPLDQHPALDVKRPRSAPLHRRIRNVFTRKENGARYYMADNASTKTLPATTSSAPSGTIVGDMPLHGNPVAHVDPRASSDAAVGSKPARSSLPSNHMQLNEGEAVSRRPRPSMQSDRGLSDDKASSATLHPTRSSGQHGFDFPFDPPATVRPEAERPLEAPPRPTPSPRLFRSDLPLRLQQSPPRTSAASHLQASSLGRGPSEAAGVAAPPDRVETLDQREQRPPLHHRSKGSIGIARKPVPSSTSSAVLRRPGQSSRGAPSPHQQQSHTNPFDPQHSYEQKPLPRLPASPPLSNGNISPVHPKPTYPRQVMENASIIARLSQVEDRLGMVESHQSSARKRLEEAELRLKGLMAREPPSGTDANTRAGTRDDDPLPLEQPQNAGKTWLKDSSSPASIGQVPPPRLSRKAVQRPDTSSTGEDPTQQSKVLRESMLLKGNSFAIQRVFSVVNREHSARLALEEDVAFIREALGSLRKKHGHQVSEVHPNFLSALAGAPALDPVDSAHPSPELPLHSRFSSDTTTSTNFSEFLRLPSRMSSSEDVWGTPPSRHATAILA